MNELQVQTRSENGDIRIHKTINDAFNYADQVRISDPIIKISWTMPITNERIRLIRSEHGWILEDVYGGRINPEF